MDHSAGIPSFAGKHKHARACFTCGETSHIARNCPSHGDKEESSTPTHSHKRNARACFTCGETSHIARNCPAGGGEEERSTPTVRTHSHQRPKPPKQHKLFVTGLPRYGTARRWKNRIADTFRSADIKISKIRLGVNDSNHLKGFFYVNVLSTDEPRALAATLHAFNEETETTYSLTLSKSTPGKVDMLFPSLSYEQRARLKFDPTAVFSCSDELTADLTTRISLAMCNLGTVDLDKGAGLSVLDMFGCVGGNAISYAKSKKFDSVTSVELDEGRCEMLRHNVQIASCNKERYDPACVNCIQGDGVAVGMSKYHHVIWLDPPWGGNEYKKGGREIDEFQIVSNDVSMSIREVIVAVSPFTDLIVYRLPNNFDVDGLLAWCVHPETGLCGHRGGSFQDRPLPFRMRMGHKCTLVVLCLPSSRPNRVAATTSNLSFGLDILDAMVDVLHTINRDLLKELHPKFFDWEKQRNIRLRDWKGVVRYSSSDQLSV